MRNGSLPYFHARIYASFWNPGRTIYRVYFTDTDFLFVHLGIGTLTPEDQMQQTAMVAGGGALPALIAGVANYYAASVGRERLNRLNKSLEAADEEVLREFVAEDTESFAIPFQEVRDVHLKPKTFWSSMALRDLVAFLTFSCASRGSLTLALISAIDLPTMAEEVQRVFGELPHDAWRAI